VGAGLALAAAIALFAFVGGYIAGHERGNGTFQALQTVTLGRGHARAVVEFGPADANGNTPMLVKVSGLRGLPRDDYYSLLMTKNGKPVVTCGTFNVKDQSSTTLRWTIAYDPAEFDGLQLARWRHSDHRSIPLFPPSSLSRS
jgi:hypothetical protein